MRYLGVDFGTKRIGLAVSGHTGDLAFPLATLTPFSQTQAVDELQAIIAKEQITAVVFGLPQTKDEQETPLARQVRNTALRVRRRTGLPVHLVPEAFTSQEAASRLKEAGVSLKKQHELLDQMAAVAILENHLREPERSLPLEPLEKHP